MNSTKSLSLMALTSLTLFSGCQLTLDPNQGGDGQTTPTPTPAPSIKKELFDDFQYQGSSDPLLTANGWVISHRGGGPGPGNFDRQNVTFEANADLPLDKWLLLDAQSDGAAITKAEITSVSDKFFEGTYAARVYFSDMAYQGQDTDSDKLVQTFYTIVPLAAPMDPDYREIDFEYLPNGGWGMPSSTLFETTWETYNPDPWQKDGISDWQTKSFAGWQELTFTVKDGWVSYYVNGELVAKHGDKYYPEGPMFMSFNHWFISADTTLKADRRYQQKVDWVYFVADEVLTQGQINARVNQLRSEQTGFIDTVF